MASLPLRAALGLTAFLAAAPAAAESAWSEAAPLPSPRQEIYATTHGGLIYTGGGLAEEASAVRGDFLAYDPEADTWQTLAPLFAARHHITFTALGETIYAVGGFSGGFPDWRPESTVWA